MSKPLTKEIMDKLMGHYDVFLKSGEYTLPDQEEPLIHLSKDGKNVCFLNY